MLRFLGAAVLVLGLMMGAARAQTPANCPGGASVRTVDAASYTLTTADNCWWLNFTAAGTIQINLPTPNLFFAPVYQTTLIPMKMGTNIVLTVVPDPQTGITGTVNSQPSITLSGGAAVELRVGVGPNWHAALFGGAGGVAGPGNSTSTIGNIVTWSNTTGNGLADSGIPIGNIIAFSANNPLGSLQIRTSTSLAGLAIGSAFSTAGNTFNLAANAACFNLGPWSGDLTGSACSPPTLAAGAASRNIGSLSNGLTGNLPGAGLNPTAVVSALGTPGGDLGGASFSAPQVVALRGFPIDPTPPTPGSSLVWGGGSYVQTVISPGINQTTGDVAAGPGAGSQVATINPGVVTNQKLALMAPITLKANSTAAQGPPQDVSVSGGLGFIGGALQIAPTGVTAQAFTVLISAGVSACMNISATGQVTGITSGTCSGGAELTADDGATVLTADDATTHLTADGTSPVGACTAIKADGHLPCNSAIVAFFR